MKLYAESRFRGLETPCTVTEEVTPEFLDKVIESSEVCEKIGFSVQVIADLVVEFPDNRERVKAMIERYHVTREQALFALLLPFHDVPLYFDKDEYSRQIKRLKTLRRLVKDMQEVKEGRRGF